uniref:DUF2493 domain-containing protein n=1 Tax=viral metagenome TaxID=1070528 RepID=A0A6C0AF61_9ZZZZ
MITLSIIGSSGNNGKMNIFSEENFQEMMHKIENIVGDEWKNVTLVSGGSSGADHLAVKLTIKHKCKLNLHLPCHFKTTHQKFDEKNNYGKLLNDLHFQFSEKINSNTLEELDYVIQLSSTNIFIYKGFLQRNVPVSQSDGMIAFTDSGKNTPGKGGTFHTWNLCKSENKIHINI